MAATPAALPAVRPAVDTFARAGHLSVALDAETTRMLLGEVPAAFHAGVHDILLIAFGLAVAEFLGTGGAPVGIDVEGHGRHEELGAEVDLSRTVGWFTTKYPVALAVGGLGWAQVLAGEAVFGAVIKDAKEQLRALPDPLSYGVLRCFDPRLSWPGPARRSGLTIWGGWARRRPRHPVMCGGSARRVWSRSRSSTFFTYICVTKDALGVAKDEMAAKPLVLYEADDLVALHPRRSRFAPSSTTRSTPTTRTRGRCWCGSASRRALDQL